jgi:hypothetical protein
MVEVRSSFIALPIAIWHDPIYTKAKSPAHPNDRKGSIHALRRIFNE